MSRILICVLSVGLVTGCNVVQGPAPDVGDGLRGGINTDVNIRPRARPEGLETASLGGVAPPATATSVEEFDTTSTAERAAATEVSVSAGERSLGRTVASLGSPTEPGFWLKTPLVQVETQGRVVYNATGKSVQVTLIPIDGPTTAGSRMSLPALRLLEAPLTGLPEVDVFADA